MPTDTKASEAFDAAYTRLIGHEGFYSNDPDDTGGETFHGISRVYNPDWPGWEYIDKAQDGEYALDVETLDRLARDFYIKTRWNVFRGDEVAAMDPALATTLLNISTHLIPSTAVMYLQKALNALNRDGALYPDLKTDGNMGDKTIAATRALCGAGDGGYLIKAIGIQQGMYYLNHAKEKFIRGFLNRVEIL